MASAIALSYRCVKCGRATDWDEALGDKPLCDKCWDKETDSSFEAELTGKEFSRRNQLAYRGELQDSEREANEPYVWVLDGVEDELRRIHYRNNRERICAVKRRYHYAKKQPYRNHCLAYMAVCVLFPYLTYIAELKEMLRDYPSIDGVKRSPVDLDLVGEPELCSMREYATGVVARMKARARQVNGAKPKTAPLSPSQEGHLSAQASGFR